MTAGQGQDAAPASTPERIVHGGSLEQAARLFPDAQLPWIDLSTGINPHAYSRKPAPTWALTRLPEPGLHVALCNTAAEAWGVGQGAAVVAGPGTQMLLPQVMMLVMPGVAAVLSPTYAEHRRAAAIAGHQVREAQSVSALYDADLVVVVNPNNPDGRALPREELLDLAAHLKRKRGLLVVDEAFIDASDVESVTDCVGREDVSGALIVLRSFGKFYGLAGVRLGFAIACRAHAERLEAILGPWAVSGPALVAGQAALADTPWRMAMRKRLAAEASRLDRMLIGAGLSIVGGTGLFRLARHDRAQTLFTILAQHGVWVRRFEAESGLGADVLRFGLPPDKAAVRRVAQALDRFRATFNDG